eukprot:scaffold29670_cov55-Attheya_sp.AAC.6
MKGYLFSGCWTTSPLMIRVSEKVLDPPKRIGDAIKLSDDDTSTTISSSRHRPRLRTGPTSTAPPRHHDDRSSLRRVTPGAAIVISWSFVVRGSDYGFFELPWDLTHSDLL